MSTTPRADTTPGPYLAAVAGDNSPNATTSSTTSPDSPQISVEAASPNPPTSELAERMRMMELQTAMFLQQHKDDFSAMSELLGRGVGHQGEDALLCDVSPPQQPVLTASKILAAQTSLTPDNTAHHYNFLSSYRLRDLDPHAVHKLPNGSRIKSVGDVVSLLRKDEPCIMTNFEGNENAAGHGMLRMIQNLVNTCENSPVRMEISTVVQVLLRVLTRNPHSSWTAKIGLLLSNIYLLLADAFWSQAACICHP